MPLTQLKIKPGVVKDLTNYATGKLGPFWTDSDKVRFKNGFPTKIGGWEKESLNGLDASGDVDQEVNGVTASYTAGGMTLAITHESMTNSGYADGADVNETMVSMKMDF